MDSVFKNINAAPLPPRKTPYKSTTIRVPKNDQILSRQPRSDLLCTVCDQPGRLKCSACHLMRYCSSDCQKEDFSQHRLFCKSFERFTDDKRPSPQHIRAILFPQDKKKPEWKWVLRNDDRTAVALSDMYAHLPTDGLTQMTGVWYLNCSTERVAQHWLFSLFLDQSTQGENKSIINHSAMNLGPPGHLNIYWGPILIVSGMPEMAASSQHREFPMIARLEDLSMHDTSFVIEATLYGDKDTPCVVDVPRYPHKSLPALKVNCFGDRCRFNTDKDISRGSDAREATAEYETVTVPNKEELPLSRQYPAILPFLLGLPWLCRRVYNCFPDYTEEDWRHTSTPGRLVPSILSNTGLRWVHSRLRQHGTQLVGLLEEVDPKKPANIETPLPAGTMILVHVFGEPIRKEHVVVLNLFVDNARLQDWWLPGYGYKTFNRDLFRKFWDERKSKNDVRGVNLSDVPSPYAWLDKPRRDTKYFIEGFSKWEGLLADTVTDVYFDNVFRGGRSNPAAEGSWAGITREEAEEYFDPLN